MSRDQLLDVASIDVSQTRVLLLCLLDAVMRVLGSLSPWYFTLTSCLVSPISDLTNPPVCLASARKVATFKPPTHVYRRILITCLNCPNSAAAWTTFLAEADVNIAETVVHFAERRSRQLASQIVRIPITIRNRHTRGATEGSGSI